MDKLHVLDLYCGAGGFSEGFRKVEEIEILHGVDNNKDALEVFNKNHNGKGLEVDLSKAGPEEFFKEYAEISKTDVDIVIGGPPCQGFSVAGEQAEEDKRRNHIDVFLDYVEFIKPLGVVIENVPNLENELHDNGLDYREHIHKRLNDAGYQTESQVVNSAKFGVPQTRRRLFFLSVKTGRDFDFPEQTYKILNNGDQEYGG